MTNTIALNRLLSNLYGAFGLEGIAWIEGIDSCAKNAQKYANMLGANFPSGRLMDLKREAYIRCFEIKMYSLNREVDIYHHLSDEEMGSALDRMESEYKEANECARRLSHYHDKYRDQLNPIRNILDNYRYRQENP